MGFPHRSTRRHRLVTGWPDEIDHHCVEKGHYYTDDTCLVQDQRSKTFLQAPGVYSQRQVDTTTRKGNSGQCVPCFPVFPSCLICHRRRVRWRVGCSGAGSGYGDASQRAEHPVRCFGPESFRLWKRKGHEHTFARGHDGQLRSACNGEDSQAA